MKQDIYNTEAVLTDSSLVCCSCDCKCGAKQTDDKRNLCVHVLVVPFLLTVLLVEDLAEHFLVEITGMMPNLLVKLVEWSEAIRQQLVEDLYALMKAAGCTQLTKASARGMTLAELLEKFIVGTEQTKDWKQRIKSRQHPSELGPISKMCFLSPERKAAEVLK